jgi:hypothetical protein
MIHSAIQQRRLCFTYALLGVPLFCLDSPQRRSPQQRLQNCFGTIHNERRTL